MIKLPQVQNMRSNKGNDIPNQFEIFTKEGKIFQSYSTVICFIESKTRKIFLDPKYSYSNTTSKYRNQFLNMTTKEIEKKIKTGEIVVKNLN